MAAGSRRMFGALDGAALVLGLLLALIDDWGDRQLAQNRSELDFERYLGDDPRRAIADDLAARYRELRRDGGLYLVLLELGRRPPADASAPAATVPAQR